MQCAIDNAKRTFDIDIPEEIKRIKRDMGISENLYPTFWKYIKKDVRKEKINSDLQCPMNYLCSIKFREFKPKERTLPMSYFYKKIEIDPNDRRRKSRKVEELIEKYSLKLYNYYTDADNEKEEYLLLRNDFDELIEDIRRVYISRNYSALMSWLINRAFKINKGVRSNLTTTHSKTNRNRVILLKVLYNVNPTLLLDVLSKNLEMA